jgi:hypothetical protein
VAGTALLLPRPANSCALLLAALRLPLWVTVPPCPARCACAAHAGWLHPTINIASPEEGVDLAVVCAGEKQQGDVRVALSNSFGFGGHNSCVIFKKFE